MLRAGGIDDILITFNILGKTKLNRLHTLTKRARISVVADSSEVVDGLADAFAKSSSPLPVLVECNTGADRCGVSSPEEVSELAFRIATFKGLEFKGVMSYPPAGQAGEAVAWLNRASQLIRKKGLFVEVVSSGGSPDMWKAHEVPGLTEYRTGTYVYNDRSLVMRGVCNWNDCALTVLATVVSVPSEHHAVIDAGSKVLTSDLLGLSGYGHVLGRDDLQIDQLSEEHGRLVSQDAVSLSVGQQVQIVPNHACVVANMLDYVQLTRGTQIIGREKVTARGHVW